MSKFISSRTSLCNIVCAVLLVVLIAMQCMPFWHYGEAGEKDISINGYIWFPTDNTDVEKYLQEQTDPDFSVEKILMMPIVVLAGGIIGIILCLWKADNPLVSLLPAAVGAVGVWGYLAKAAFRLGTNWQLHMVVCVAIVAVAAISLIFGMKELKKN